MGAALRISGCCTLFKNPKYSAFRRGFHLMSRLVSAVCVLLSLLFINVSQAFAAIRYVPVDISSYCTHSFSDDKAGDKQGGWTDQGSGVDLSMFPTGECVYDGIPFKVIDSRQNSGKSCILLNIDGFAPKIAKGIAVGAADVKRIHFLQISCYNSGADVGKYVVNYRYSGEEYKKRLKAVSMGYQRSDTLTYPLDIPLITGVNICDWYNPAKDAQNAKIVWRGANSSFPIGILHYAWDNPNISSYIDTIDFHAPETNNSVPVLIAMTLEINDSSFLPAEKQKEMYYEAQKLVEKSVEKIKDSSDALADEITGISVESLKSSIKELSASYALPGGSDVRGKLKNLQDKLDQLRKAAESDPKVTFVEALKSAKSLDGEVSNILRLKDKAKRDIYARESIKIKKQALDEIRKVDSILKGRSGYYARISRIYQQAAKIYASASETDSRRIFLNAKNALYWAERAEKRALNAANHDTIIPGNHVSDLSEQTTLPADTVRSRVCLNGKWDVSKNGSGDSYPEDGWFSMSVPHTTWTDGSGGSEFLSVNALNGVKWSDDQKFAWYKTSFDMPVIKAKQKVEIEFKKVWCYAEVFVNGKYCGNHYGGSSRFFIDISKAVVPGKRNSLVVYVEDGQLTLREDGTNMANIYYFTGKRQGGIYDDVFLHILPTTQITDPFVQTSYRKKNVRVSFLLKSAAKADEKLIASCCITGEGGFIKKLGNKTISNAQKEISFASGWKNPVLWGPSQPWGKPGALYTAVIEVRNSRGGLVDRLEVPFGFREFYKQGDKLYLNGKEMFFQGDHIDMCSNGGFTFRNPEFAVNYMHVARGANIDFIRTHCLEAPDWWWDIADQQGMMFEMHNHILNGYWTVIPDRNWEDPVLKQYLTRDLLTSLKEYRNHPSIVMWTPTNELFVAGERGIDEAARFWKKMDSRMKKIDPTRLIHHQGANGLAGTDPFPFDVACVHYGQDADAKSHAKMFPGVPVVFGELMDLSCLTRMYQAKDPASFNQTLLDAYSYVDQKYNSCRKYGVAGIAPYQMIQWLALESIDDRNRPEDFRNIQWPSYSGIGVRTNIAYGSINWHRDDVPMVKRNVFYQNLKSLYQKRDPLADGRPLEVIIDGALPGQTVYASRTGSKGDLEGVKADNEGRAWFLLRDSGDYLFFSGNNEVHSKLSRVPYVENGGFSHILRLSLEKQR